MQAIRYLAGARRDFDESFDWYSARSPETALRFLGAVRSALTRIQSSPSTFVLIDGVHQESPVSKFPFRSIFRSVKDEILIVAIAHAKRRPGFWTGRS